jgi:hypothetical protein
LGKVVQSDLNSKFLVQVISTKDTIRSKNLDSELRELGLRFEISPGVVPNENEFQGASLHSAFLSSLLCQRSITIGEVGCALAHRNAVSRFLNSNQKFGIVFEDDAEIISSFDFDMIMQFMDSELPKIIVLGWIPGYAIAKDAHISLTKGPIELITSPTCAFAYALNRPAAKLMVSNQEKIVDLADWPIFLLNKVKFYAVDSFSPWVTANHDPKFSVIGKRSNTIANNQIKVLVSRVKLATSLVTLIFLSIVKVIDVSPRQIVHRVLIRDLIYNYGTSQVNEELDGNKVIVLSSKWRKFLDFWKITQFTH